MSRGHKALPHQDQSGRFYGACNCGWNSGPNRFLLKWQADDTVRVHLANVERAMAGLRKAAPTLKQERDHAREMLDDPATPAADRAAWQVLFDGANQRLNEGAYADDAKLW